MESDDPYETFTTKKRKKIYNSFKERNLGKYYLFRKSNKSRFNLIKKNITKNNIFFTNLGYGYHHGLILESIQKVRI